MEVRDCEFIVSLRYSHDRVPLCCCQSNYKLGSRDYACLPSPGIVLPSGRFKPGLNNTSHTSFSPKPNRLIYASIKNQMFGWEKYNNKGSPRFIRKLLTDFSSPPPAVDGPRQQSLTNGIFFCLFFLFSFLTRIPRDNYNFSFWWGAVSRLLYFRWKHLAGQCVCERDGSHCVSRCAWQQQLSLTWLCFHI